MSSFQDIIENGVFSMGPLSPSFEEKMKSIVMAQNAMHKA